MPTADPEQGAKPTRANPLRRLVVTLVRVLAVLLVIGLIVRYPMGEWFESKVFYLPSRAPFATPTGYEDVSIPGPDGRTLHGWFIRAADAAPGEVRPAVLHVHGNAGAVDTHAAFCAWLADHGYHVLVFDYRGYGRSDPGRPTRRGLCEDTRAAWRAMVARDDVDAGRSVLFGFSMGSVAGLAAAGEGLEPPPAGVVAASGFSNWPGIAGDHLPIVGPALVRRGLDAQTSIARLGDTPVLIVHGEADPVVPVYHAQRLHDAAQSAGVPVTLVTVPGADHNTLLTDYPEAHDAIVAFIERVTNR